MHSLASLQYKKKSVATLLSLSTGTMARINTILQVAVAVCFAAAFSSASGAFQNYTCLTGTCTGADCSKLNTTCNVTADVGGCTLKGTPGSYAFGCNSTACDNSTNGQSFCCKSANCTLPKPDGNPSTQVALNVGGQKPGTSLEDQKTTASTGTTNQTTAHNAGSQNHGIGTFIVTWSIGVRVLVATMTPGRF